MALKRYADAVWNGDLQSGKGSLSTPQSGLFEAQNYSFKTRFGDEKGTNPEELLAVAHAGCFSMALSAVLGKAGFTPDKIQTRAEATMEPGMDPGPTVTGIKLTVSASVPGISAAQFEEIAQQAKAGCVISRALSVPVSLEATLL
ncbi:OsmC family protein [Pseudoxanthomonas sp. PXM03]|jgi:osmotically inducible protein OsmC|uniref:OsmC family protein n=1 Tax=unclassified Pseudoxanthomonas TaxID=2645906 RepID=UPI001169A1DD|nr:MULTISPECIES: OsmC family protein [unclassified Pseudoxanthomonas]MBD9435316.1 OsmC family protein [Pseudoxanthomonas sp. PXM03]TQM17661.1 osmotically inducible protein OsmC [Pseudoxanthomonas sp. 3HH-4]